MRRLLIILLLMLPLEILAQSVISGRVTDATDSQAIEGLIVRLRVGEKDLSYDLTNSEGIFRLECGGSAEEVELIFSLISYKTKSLLVENKTQFLDTEMEVEATQIKEVSVSAPKIQLRGDTISYNLSAFKGANDVTLEDALKKLPGVEVSESGEISYMGRDISKFYIEDLDLLGGRYSVATTNITADMVATVEVMENHQPIKMLQGKSISDAVAMNIKLKEKAKLKPTGNIEGSLGYSDEQLLYRLGITGMLFSKKFQTISTLKYGNVGAQNSAMTIAHYMSLNAKKCMAMDLLGSLSASTPPLDQSRYLNQSDGVASINTVSKLSDGQTFRVNANYGYTNSNYAYSTISDYYIGDSREIVDEQSTPSSIIHTPSLDIDFTNNQKDFYLSNSFTSKLSILDNQLPTINDGSLIEQSQKALDYSLSNRFNLRKSVGSGNISFQSVLSYVATPDNAITYSSALYDGYNYIQNADGRGVFANSSFEFTSSLNSYLRVSLPVSLDYGYNHLNTYISGRDTEPNDLDGYDLTAKISPRLEYTSPSRRVELTLSTPIGYSLLEYNQAPKVYNKLLYSPNLDLKLTLSPSSSFRLNGYASNGIGDATDFLVNPIQTSYRSATIMSGILSESEQQGASLRYDYKLPLSYLFFNASVGYNRSRRNLLSSQYVYEEDIITSNMLGDNQSESYSLSATVSKHFHSIATKVDLSGSYTHSTGDVVQQEVLTSYLSNYYRLASTINTTPLKWLELRYRGSLVCNSSKYMDVESRLVQQSHNLRVNLMPTDKLSLFAQIDYVNNQISETDFVQMALLDVGAKYTFKKVELQLSLNNLLNTKQYAYTIFSGLDTYSYNYNLRGSEIVLSFRWL